MINNLSDFRTMQTDVSNGLLCLMEGKEDGVNFICYLETTDNISENVQKNAGSIAYPESYTSNY